MPNVSEMDTKDIIDAIAPYVESDQSATELLDELKAREIVENDLDDTEQHRGGIRPQHQPLFLVRAKFDYSPWPELYYIWDA